MQKLIRTIAVVVVFCAGIVVEHASIAQVRSFPEQKLPAPPNQRGAQPPLPSPQSREQIGPVDEMVALRRDVEKLMQMVGQLQTQLNQLQTQDASILRQVQVTDKRVWVVCYIEKGKLFVGNHTLAEEVAPCNNGYFNANVWNLYNPLP